MFQDASKVGVQEQVNFLICMISFFGILKKVKEIDVVVWSSGPHQKNNQASWQVCSTSEWFVLKQQFV